MASQFHADVNACPCKQSCNIIHPSLSFVFHCPQTDLVSSQFARVNTEASLLATWVPWGWNWSPSRIHEGAAAHTMLLLTFSSSSPPPNTQLATAKTQAKKNMSSNEHQNEKLHVANTCWQPLYLYPIVSNWDKSTIQYYTVFLVWSSLPSTCYPISCFPKMPAWSTGTSSQ